MVVMTRDKRDRWAVPSIDQTVLSNALDPANRGKPQPRAAVSLPSWATASVVFDVDGVLLLEVRCWRPNRSPSDLLSALADQLSALHWRELQHGPLTHHRSDGVGCPGAWASWTRATP